VTDARTKRQQRAAATADQLLVAAREVFESKGYVATTVGAITEAANTAHGTFYLYFKNKEDVFSKVMAQVGEDLARESTAPWAGDPYEALLTALRGYVGVVGAHRGLWRCLFEGMHQSAALFTLWLEARRSFVNRIQNNLEGLVESAAIRPLDPRLTAAALGSMVEWTAFCFVELSEPPGGGTLDDLARTLADVWFTTVFGRVSPTIDG
jgi:AcrR family transcriptional regulator